MQDNKYLQAFGIQTYRRKNVAQATVDTPDAWQQLKSQVINCTACDLHQTRTHAVFGVGNENAELMIIGEAPGFHEDQQGEPFVGRAGMLLNEMLKAIQFARSDVYIANIIKCRPPNNRDPIAIEVQTCTPYLAQQIFHIKPKLLLALGRVAAHYLLKNKLSLENLRNKIHTYTDTNTPLIVTYHPAYLLRNLIDKKKAYQDLLFVKKTLGEMSHGSNQTNNYKTLSRY